ncbi:DUF2384 domain-containing protein [Alphaproteobacteria bacterium HT1-32]|nr:DUF2384 domain-containing protein [Alphaproteobacteria bacterium HT1-32]
MSGGFGEQVAEFIAPSPMGEREQITVIIRAVVRVAENWGLSNAEAAALFDVPSATWSRMKAGTFRGSLDQDKMTRASLIIGIFKGLRLLFNGPLQNGWPKLPNKGPFFEGSSPVSFMIAHGIPGLSSVRQHIDALRGGI